jgi:hypothetical protein
MSEINYTWLRYAMLMAVKDGRVTLRQGRWVYRSHPSTPAQMTRAVKSLQFAGLVAVVSNDDVGLVELTEAGETAREQWAVRQAAA